MTHNEYYTKLKKKLWEAIDNLPEQSIDEKGYLLVRYGDVASALDKTFMEMENKE